jgi:serine/threonine-protein kinase
MRPDVPPGLVAVVARCLEKKASLRFASIADLADALDEFTSPESRGAAKRIRRVTDESSPRSLGVVSARGPVSSRVSVSGGTSVSWGETELAGRPVKKRSMPWIPIGGGAGGVIAIGILAIVLARSGSRSTAQPEPTASVIRSAAAAGTNTAPQNANGLPPAPSSSVAPSTSAPSTSASSPKVTGMPIGVTTKPTASIAPVASTVVKPPPTAPTTTVGGGRPKDDMPTDRH